MHNCSLQVVRNASAEPIKYVMKYFNISPNEQTLAAVEALGESITRLEDAVGNLELREQTVTERVSPPRFIILIETLGTKIRWAKSAAGQRKLMTNKLREAVKERDGYTCQQCSMSLADQSHLLLEVDHKIPVSRGGLTLMENLQTLCRRCNRSKSNKVTPGHTERS